MSYSAWQQHQSSTHSPTSYQANGFAVQQPGQAKRPPRSDCNGWLGSSLLNEPHPITVDLLLAIVDLEYWLLLGMQMVNTSFMQVPEKSTEELDSSQVEMMPPPSNRTDVVQRKRTGYFCKPKKKPPEQTAPAAMSNYLPALLHKRPSNINTRIV